MKEHIDNAREELKRVDHLIFVSLKYTRTVDVIKSVIERLLNALEITVNSLLEYAKKKKMIKEIPESTLAKTELLNKIFNDDMILDLINFYAFLRKISRAEYKKSREYRRHVTMSAIIDEGIINIEIDTVREYYDKTKNYVDYAEEMFGLRKE